MNINYKCPICQKDLKKTDKSYICPGNHSFDIAKQGYVNFAAVKKSYTSLSGDSKQMCLDRRNFLANGFYFPLAHLISDTISELYQNTNITVIDAGCGEGYYLRTVRELCHDLNPFLFGFDLSKEAIKLAATTEKSGTNVNKISYSVSGIFDMPFFDASADFVLSVFAPVCDTESARVLKKGGYLLVACPGKNHLLGLKEKIYDSARTNEEKIPEYPEFDLVGTKHISFDINVSKQFIPCLFGMTPYFWKSSKQTQNAVMGLDELTTCCDFLLKIYKKK